MKTEQKIAKLLLDLKEDVTIREIAKEIGADYKITHTAVKRLVKKGIISEKKIGRSIACSLNRWKDELICIEMDRSNELGNDIRQIRKEIIANAKTSFFTLLLFGSYAKGKQAKGSDIDLMFISDKDMEKDINSVLGLLPFDIHALYLTEKEFLSMTGSRGGNVVKEALGNYRALYGIESLYRMMNHAK